MSDEILDPAVLEFRVRFRGKKALNACLRIFAENGDLPGMRLALLAGADANAKNKDGDTPMHLAARNGHTEAVDKLCFCEGRFDVINKAGDNPVHEMARHGHTESLMRLRGCYNAADLRAMNYTGQTPITLARINGHTQTLAFLFTRMPSGQLTFPPTVAMNSLTAAYREPSGKNLITDQKPDHRPPMKPPRMCREYM